MSANRNISALLISELNGRLRDANLNSKETYEEKELRPVILRFLSSFEHFASVICKPFNQLGLLAALQHQIPRYIVEPKEGFEADMQILFNNTAALAFHHCSATKDATTRLTRYDYEKIAATEDFTWLDDYSDAIEDIYYLANVTDNIVKILRWLGKGATAKLDFSGDTPERIIVINIPNNLSEKMSVYDDRLIHNQQLLLMRHGMPFGITKPDSPLKCLVVNPNWRDIRKGNINPAPLPLVFGMDAFHGIMTFHDDEVIALFNRRVHVEDFFIFMSALFKPLVEQATNNVRFAGQGYSFVEIRHLTDYIASWAPKIYADCFNQGIFPDGTAFVIESLRSEYWKEVVPHMLKFISHSASTRSYMDWLLFRPTKFAYLCDDEIIFLHLGTVLHFFMSMLEHFEKTGKFGEIKGKLMENLLIQVIEQVDGFERIWEPRHKIDYPVSGKANTDVDVFVRRGELAFLISCKSYGVNREYELGNGQTCWDRSEDAKGLLKFAHRTAKVIAAHHKELGLPNSIKGILPFGCTGWPEYIFEPSHKYYIKDGMPRVATVKEIEEYFKNLDDNKCKILLADPWFVPIAVSE